MSDDDDDRWRKKKIKTKQKYDPDGMWGGGYVELRRVSLCGIHPQDSTRCLRGRGSAEWTTEKKLTPTRVMRGERFHRTAAGCCRSGEGGCRRGVGVGGPGLSPMDARKLVPYGAEPFRYLSSEAWG